MTGKGEMAHIVVLGEISHRHGRGADSHSFLAALWRSFESSVVKRVVLSAIDLFQRPVHEIHYFVEND